MKREEELTVSVKAEAEPVAWRWVWKTTGSPLEQRFADPDLYSWTYRETPPSGEAAKKMVIEPLYSHPQKKNVEPVAWTVQHHLDRIEGTTGSAIIWGKKTSPVDIPLYAHPPKPEATEGVTEYQFELAADRLVAAIEGELDGLCVEMDKARTIIDFVLTETFGRAPSEDLPQVPWPASDWAIDRIAELEAALKATEGGAHEKGMVETIAKILWERFSPEHEVDWPSTHAAEYRLASSDIIASITGWRPIKTAPQDGRPILARYEWQGQDRFMVIRRHKEHPWWMADHDSYIKHDDSKDTHRNFGFTHWIPVPSALNAKPEQTEHVDTDVLENSASLNTSRADGGGE